MQWAWVGIFTVGAIVGLVDFWLWEYDYGHNLDAEKAIIKIPGMNYQPPLIGSKKLLNFTASSWPATGGWVAFISLGSVIVSAVRSRRRRKPAVVEAATPGLSTTIMAASACAAMLLSACRVGPSPIAYGEDHCDHCRMTILDERFGAELVNVHGKAYRFDSIECLASHVAAENPPGERIHSMWVTDFGNPGTLVEVHKAVILRSSNVSSPMGMNLAAFGPAVDGDKAINAFGGQTLAWDEVLDLMVSQESLRPASLTK